MTSSSSPYHNIIRQVDNDEAPKGLGVYMNFKGTFGFQAKKMCLKFGTIGTTTASGQDVTPLGLQVLLHYVFACC
jgi:hypothetical protein